MSFCLPPLQLVNSPFCRRRLVCSKMGDFYFFTGSFTPRGIAVLRVYAFTMRADACEVDFTPFEAIRRVRIAGLSSNAPSDFCVFPPQINLWSTETTHPNKRTTRA